MRNQIFPIAVVISFCFFALSAFAANGPSPAIGVPAMMGSAPSMPAAMMPPPNMPEAPMAGMSGTPSVFAVFNNAKCPKGSKPYDGPEQKMAATEGVTYCEFMPIAVVMHRPPGMDLNNKKLPEEIRKNMQAMICPPQHEICKFDDPELVPPEGIVWCCRQRQAQPSREGR